MTAKTRSSAGAARRPGRAAAPGALSARLLNELKADFQSNPAYARARNAVAETSIDKIAINRSIAIQADHSFSKTLDDWKATSQKASGRCWMFAGLNLCRVGAMRKMKLKNFEFSQNYTFFWDKIERSNYFLEAIVQTADRPVDDRTVAFLLAHPIDDGGQWNMFVNIVKKHGLVPKAAMPETESSSNSRRMNASVVEKLREGAKILRDRKTAGASPADLRAAKEEILRTVYRILAIHLGEPPGQFDWQWMDKDRKFHRDGAMTPRQFAAKYLALPLDEYVCLVHDPRPSSPAGRTFTVEHLGNVVGGGLVLYLNVEIQTMKQAAMKTILDGEPVWVGCDVAKQMDRTQGLWDANLIDYGGVYDTVFGLDKAARLEYGQTQMTHAMLFTGVDVVAGKPRRWRVENSWGEENGQKGFYLMNDSWFDEYMFEIAVHRKYLPARLRAAIGQKPIVLPPWDPMGALAWQPAGNPCGA